MNRRHKWIGEIREETKTIGGYAYPNYVSPPLTWTEHSQWWVCERCGCAVRYGYKPKRFRDMKKLGIAADCTVEMVRQILES